jgi:hypothetical protein
LWPGDETVSLNQPSLYEYAGINNREPRLVGVSNIGPPQDIAASKLISECGTYLGGLIGPQGYAHNAVSKDGNTVFFTALGRDYGLCGNEGISISEPTDNELYARIDGSLADARTVAISEPDKADCRECDLSSKADAEFQGTSFEGTKVFFTTTQHLLDTASGVGKDLYEYDFGGPVGERVTRVSGGDPAGAQVQRVVGVSDDGSHVYFLARGVLTTGVNSSGQGAEEGAENLYVYGRDAAHPSGYLVFIGTGDVGAAQVTPDGHFLVFTSKTDLTADEEGRAEAGQVFEYDAQTGSLTRVSRGEAGYNENGNSDTYAATIPGQGLGLSIPINRFTGLTMSADGSYVFFASEDGLTSQAVGGLNNVYEYHEGHVMLISSGHDVVSVNGGSAVRLLGTDMSGRDVYFETAEQLVGQDTDTQLDTYDARIEGGFPMEPRDASCSDDVCQRTLTEVLRPPSVPTLSSGGESLVPAAIGAKPTAKKHKLRKHPKSKKRRKGRLHRAKRATGGHGR